MFQAPTPRYRQIVYAVDVLMSLLTHIVGHMGPVPILVANAKAKKAGHQDNATFDNKLGGSTAFCVPEST